MQLQIFKPESWEVRDYLAFYVFGLLTILLILGHNGTISAMMIAIVTWYFVRRNENPQR